MLYTKDLACHIELSIKVPGIAEKINEEVSKRERAQQDVTYRASGVRHPNGDTESNRTSLPIYRRDNERAINIHKSVAQSL